MVIVFGTQSALPLPSAFSLTNCTARTPASAILSRGALGFGRQAKGGDQASRPFALRGKTPMSLESGRRKLWPCAGRFLQLFRRPVCAGPTAAAPFAVVVFPFGWRSGWASRPARSVVVETKEGERFRIGATTDMAYERNRVAAKIAGATVPNSLNSPLTKSGSSDSVTLLSLRANQRWRWDDRALCRMT